MATRMVRCGFCMRPNCEQTEAGPASTERNRATRESAPLLSGDALFRETYCGQCERFYHQLMTFERGDGRGFDGNIPESPVQEVSQTGRTAGLPA